MKRFVAPLVLALFLLAPGVALAVTQAECAAQGLVRHPPSDTCRPSNECPISVCGIPAPSTPGANTVGTRTLEEQNRDREAAEAREAAARAQAARDTAANTAAQTGQPPPVTTTNCILNPLGCGIEAIAEGASAIADWAGGLLGDISLSFVWWLLSMVAYIFFLIAEFLMWLGTTFFDTVIFFFVLNMSVFILNESAVGIREAWMAIRDLMNIAIIGGFIAVGISTILQVQQYNASRFLARLIIAALLVNFSYFFAGTIIDASNFIAAKAYDSKLMRGEGGCVTFEQAKELNYLFRNSVLLVYEPNDLCSISKTFTKTMDFGGWDQISKYGVAKGSGGENSDKMIFFTGMIGGFFYVITGFVFFSAAVLLIGRFIVLILLLVTSPVGVAGVNIPFIDGYAKKWWSMLFSQSFFAPVFVILVAIGLRITMETKKVFEKAGSLDDANYAAISSGDFQAAANAIPLFVSFAIGVGLMYAALAISRSMSESGKEFVGAIYDGLQKRIGGFYGGLYQATAGGVLKLPSLAYDATLGQVARSQYLNYVPVVGGMLKGGLTAVGMALRQDQNAKPFGASKSYGEVAKDTQEYMKSLEPLGFLRNPIKNTKAIVQGIDDSIQNFLQKQQWLGGVGSIHDLLKKDPSKLTGAQRRLLERYAQSLKDEDIDKMSKEELEEIIPFMSVKQYKRVMERSDFNEKQRKELQDKRWAPLEKARKDGNSAEVARLLKNMDKNERKLLLIERDEYRNDKQMLAALDAKTYDEVINDSDIYSSDADYKVGGVDVRDHRAQQVANDPGKISETDAKRIKNGDVKDETIGRMTPAQARRVYKNTKDEALRARLAARFKDLEGPGPAQNDEDDDADKKKKEEDKKKEEEDKK